MSGNGIIETLTGILTIVFVLAISFFAIQDFRAFHKEDCFRVNARFPDVGGLKAGGIVELFGVSIGSVTKVTADQDSYSALVEVCIDNDIKVPVDSVLKIEDKTVIGERKAVLILGVDKIFIKPGGMFLNTQAIPPAGSLVGGLITKFAR